MSELTIAIASINDNYSYLLHKNGKTLVIDPTSASAVSEILEKKGWRLDYIINTHHHYDHVGGNSELVDKYGAKVAASRLDSKKIKNVDLILEENTPFTLGEIHLEVIEVPGHTAGHIALWLKNEKALFTGDTLFHFGCGRLFEGSASQMRCSLGKLGNLPEDTMVYCGHEYTIQNLKFALSLEPNSEILNRMYEKNLEKLEKYGATVPFMLSDDKRANPFFRSSDQDLVKALGGSLRSEDDVFAEIRRRKDHFS